MGVLCLFDFNSYFTELHRVDTELH